MSAPLENLLRDARLDLIMGRIEKDPSIIEQVIKELDSKIRSVKFNAILVLGKLGNQASSAISKLTSCLEDNDWGICRETVKSLGNMGNIAESSVLGLCKLISHKQSVVRKEVALSIGSIGYATDDAISALLTLLTDTEEEVRNAAAIALGSLKKDSSNILEALIVGLKDNNWTVRASSAVSLGQIGSTANDTIMQLIKALKDSDWRVRSKIMDALQMFGEKANPILTEVLNRKKTVFIVKKCILEVLGEIKSKDPKVIESISPYVLSLKEALRGKSIHALCNIGTSSIPSLLKSFKKADSGSLGVRILKGLGIFGVFILYFAYFGLINYISRSLIFFHNDSPLFSNILDFSDVYRIVSLLIGGIFGFFLGLLIHLKFNCPKNVRRAMILSGIGGIKEPLKDSIPEIIKTLGDLNLLSPYYQLKQNPIGAFIEDPFLKKAIVRIELCRTLGKIGIGSNLAVNVLVEKLLDNKQSVRREAALALGKLGSTASSAVPSLIQTLKDKKADIRWRAAEALGRIGQGTPQVISALEEVLYDKYDHVSAQAEFSLEKIKESQT